jgi:hypothetical protein
MGIWYLIRLLKLGPTPATQAPEHALPNRPLAAAQVARHDQPQELKGVRG